MASSNEKNIAPKEHITTVSIIDEISNSKPYLYTGKSSFEITLLQIRYLPILAAKLSNIFYGSSFLLENYTTLVLLKCFLVQFVNNMVELLLNSERKATYTIIVCNILQIIIVECLL